MLGHSEPNKQKIHFIISEILIEQRLSLNMANKAFIVFEEGQKVKSTLAVATKGPLLPPGDLVRVDFDVAEWATDYSNKVNPPTPDCTTEWETLKGYTLFYVLKNSFSRSNTYIIKTSVFYQMLPILEARNSSPQALNKANDLVLYMTNQCTAHNAHDVCILEPDVVYTWQV